MATEVVSAENVVLALEDEVEVQTNTAQVGEKTSLEPKSEEEAKQMDEEEKKLQEEGQNNEDKELMEEAKEKVEDLNLEDDNDSDDKKTVAVGRDDEHSKSSKVAPEPSQEVVERDVDAEPEAVVEDVKDDEAEEPEEGTLPLPLLLLPVAADIDASAVHPVADDA